MFFWCNENESFSGDLTDTLAEKKSPVRMALINIRPVLLFSKSNNIFVGCFDIEKTFSDNENS